MAVAASDDKVLAGVGIGFMYGRKSSPDDTDGFKENAPPPNTETAVRLEEKSRWSALVIVTRTF